ncbi:rhomboid family intramembrane serine protease [Ectothiorhodospiraceae bacterium 2226]|nr:rhomboid family intramembrane serine protease [Ectothiorhodospiraceae bacterium 2226]
MLIIPLERAIDWRRPPVVTVLLVLINAVVFFGYQAGDEERFERAADYYFASELPEIELPLYLEDLERRRAPHLDRLRRATAEDEYVLLFAMESDREFMAALRESRIVTVDHPQYALWQGERAAFEQHLHAASYFRYGLVPQKAEPVTFVTHMFLHGDLGHLIGNMVFLVLAGLAVELALGSLVYAGFYLIGGLAAAGLFFAFNLGSAVPMVGASGAISAVMGLYAILYGRRRIRFFYWVLFYFNYVKAPAYIMFILWLGHEFYQIMFGGPSNVAYLAHVGGLLAGALLALGAKAWLPGLNVAFLDAGAEQERRKTAFAEGLRLQADLKIDQALAVFEDLHRQAPEDEEVLTQLFNAASLKPGSALQHYAATRLLARAGLPVGQSHDVFRRYLQTTGGKVKLSAPALLRLATRYAKGGFPSTAQGILGALTRRGEPLPGIAEAFLAVGEAWRRQGDEQRSAACLHQATKFQ